MLNIPSGTPEESLPVLPATEPAVSRTPAGHGWQRIRSAIIQLAAVAVAAAALLFRVPGRAVWDTAYAEDWGVFLPQALGHPLHLLIPYQGYLQLLPRLIAEGVALLPLAWAAVAFSVTGAVTAGLCALFLYHASAARIRSRVLRAVLGVALILLPVAPLEIADSGVNTPWYLLVALFWALLWRPRTRGGMTAAALIAFLATASTPVAAVFAPLLLFRLFRLRRVREHAVTAGWVAGWVLQGYAIARSYADHVPRAGKLAALGPASQYYLHSVVLRLFGWHVSWALVHGLGLTGATICCTVALAVITGCVLLAGRQARWFAIVAVAGGYAYTVFAAMISYWVTYEGPVIQPVNFEPGARYTVVPIMLLTAMMIVGADALIQRHGGLRAALRQRSVPVAAMAVVLACVLGAGWVTDYRYPVQRSLTGFWLPYATKVLDSCQASGPDRARPESTRMFLWGSARAGRYVRVPCSRLHS